MLRELRQRLRSEMRRDRVILQLRAKLVAYLLINSVDNFLTRKHGRKPYRGLHGCKPANSGSACHAVDRPKKVDPPLPRLRRDRWLRPEQGKKTALTFELTWVGIPTTFCPHANDESEAETTPGANGHRALRCRGGCQKADQSAQRQDKIFSREGAVERRLYPGTPRAGVARGYFSADDEDDRAIGCQPEAGARFGANRLRFAPKGLGFIHAVQHPDGCAGDGGSVERSSSSCALR